MGAAAALLGTVLVGCGAAQEGPPSPTADRTSATAGGGATDSRERLRGDGGTREYLLHRPAARAAGPRPLVIAFHGRGSDAAELRRTTRLDKAADERGMVVAYPQGLRSAWGAGGAATGERPDPDADVRFTEALVDKLLRTERADPKKVYAVGFSNGASMALRVAAQRPDLLAGAGAVAGQLPAGRAKVRPAGPVPVMLVHGAADPVRPLAGRPEPGPPPAGEEPLMPSMSTRGSAEAFARAARAGRPAERKERGYDRTTWRGGTSRAVVQLLVVHGAGHTWPGTSAPPPKGFGRVSKDLDATGTLLDFFAAPR